MLSVDSFFILVKNEWAYFLPHCGDLSLPVAFADLTTYTTQRMQNHQCVPILRDHFESFLKTLGNNG